MQQSPLPSESAAKIGGGLSCTFHNTVEDFQQSLDRGRRQYARAMLAICGPANPGFFARKQTLNPPI